MSIANTIIAQNEKSSMDCSYVVGAMGTNIADDDTCSGFSLPNTNPMLGSLSNNGGPTSTFALLSGSRAIDAAIGSCPTVDQRGYARPAGEACDVGAIEYGAQKP